MEEGQSPSERMCRRGVGVCGPDSCFGPPSTTLADPLVKGRLLQVVDAQLLAQRPPSCCHVSQESLRVGCGAPREIQGLEDAGRGEAHGGLDLRVVDCVGCFLSYESLPFGLYCYFIVLNEILSLFVVVN